MSGLGSEVIARGQNLGVRFRREAGVRSCPAMAAMLRLAYTESIRPVNPS